MKIYLSGAITNNPNYILDFIIYKRELRYISEDIVSPIDLKPFLGIKCWFCYMVTCVYYLLHCDAIYMIPGWEKSKGARIEYKIAKAIGIEIITYKL